MINIAAGKRLFNIFQRDSRLPGIKHQTWSYLNTAVRACKRKTSFLVWWPIGLREAVMNLDNLGKETKTHCKVRVDIENE